MPGAKPLTPVIASCIRRRSPRACVDNAVGMCNTPTISFSLRIMQTAIGTNERIHHAGILSGKAEKP